MDFLPFVATTANRTFHGMLGCRWQTDSKQKEFFDFRPARGPVIFFCTAVSSGTSMSLVKSGVTH
jgi:hypothetical protein